MMLNPNNRQANKMARRGAQRNVSAHGGFTLIELMVVLVIGAIVTSIILGGFASVGANNRRTSCQVNFAQIYQATRLYTADNDNQVPPYDPDGLTVAGGPTPGRKGIGLWELYAFPADVNVPADEDNTAPVGSAVGAKPVERYLRSAKSLHCPSDYDLPASATLPSGRQSEKLYATPTTLNLSYLSYQAPNNVSDVSAASGSVPTYSSYRTRTRTATANPDEPWKRQLLHYIPDTDSSTGPTSNPPDPDTFNDSVRRAPTSDTVVTWCQFHRNGPGRRNHDIVLFWDGTVHSLPVRQKVEVIGSVKKPTREAYGGTGCPDPDCLETWQRKPPAVE